MSKCILVMDMPERCMNCSCIKRLQYNEYNGKLVVCSISGEVLHEGDIHRRRPNHCPLKEVPEKKRLTIKNSLFENAKNVGYNACIDEILGGGE